METEPEPYEGSDLFWALRTPTGISVEYFKRPLMTHFGVDESYAREANEFGY